MTGQAPQGPPNLKIYLVNIKVLKQIHSLMCTIHSWVEEFGIKIGELDCLCGNMTYEFKNLLCVCDK